MFWKMEMFAWVHAMLILFKGTFLVLLFFFFHINDLLIYVILSDLEDSRGCGCKWISMLKKFDLFHLVVWVILVLLIQNGMSLSLMKNYKMLGLCFPSKLYFRSCFAPTDKTASENCSFHLFLQCSMSWVPLNAPVMSKLV